MTTDKSDAFWMEQALRMADRGRFGAAPNPRVGCILVYEDEPISVGWHAAVGGEHAEAAALSALDPDDPRLSSSTAYVTLEPCNHHGRTPPCTERLIAAGIPRIVVGMVDPDPRVSGAGVARLRASGIRVDLMESHPEGRWMNRRFLSSLERGRPWIVLKCAVSADGFADPERSEGQRGSIAITDPLLRRLTHSWRAEEEAIIVGAGTVSMDNPRLNVRAAEGRDPMPIVLDPSGRTSPDALVWSHPEAAVLGGPQHLPGHVTRIGHGCTDAITDVLAFLQDIGCRSALVEGGPATLSGFISSGLWDELRWCRSPKALNQGLEAPAAPSSGLSILRGTHPFGEDTVEYLVRTESADWARCAPPPTLCLPLPS